MFGFVCRQYTNNTILPFCWATTKERISPGGLWPPSTWLGGTNKAVIYGILTDLNPPYPQSIFFNQLLELQLKIMARRTRHIQNQPAETPWRVSGVVSGPGHFELLSKLNLICLWPCRPTWAAQCEAH